MQKAFLLGNGQVEEKNMKKCVVCSEPSEKLSSRGICNLCEDEFNKDKDTLSEKKESSQNIEEQDLSKFEIYDDAAFKLNEKDKLKNNLNIAGSICLWIGVVLFVLSLLISLIYESLIPLSIGLGALFSAWVSSLLLQSLGKIIDLLGDIKTGK